MMVDDDKRRRGERSTILIRKGIVNDTPLPPKGSRTTIWDFEIKGFGLRVTSTGAKTYLLRYRMGGRDTPIRTITIGQHGSPWTVDQARRRAAELLTEVRSGRDIVADRGAERANAITAEAARKGRQFGLKVEEWFTDHVRRGGLRSHEDIRGVIDRDLKPVFDGKTIDELTRKDVTTALTEIGRRSGSAANKAHKCCVKCLTG